MPNNFKTESKAMEPKSYSPGDIAMWPGAPPPPTFLVDGLRGVNIANGIARLSFVEALVDPKGEDILGRQNVVLAMPVSVLKNTVENLQEILNEGEGD